MRKNQLGRGLTVIECLEPRNLLFASSFTEFGGIGLEYVDAQSLADTHLTFRAANDLDGARRDAQTQDDGQASRSTDVPAELFSRPLAADGPLPAFPGAEGFGAGAIGGRGGDVVHVKNLNDSGPGSLRSAIQSGRGPRTIVFDVSGTIELHTPLVIDRPFLTIAGQTAPAGGVTVRNHGVEISDTHDVVIRYMRFRPGDEIVGAHDALVVYRSRDVMIDHVSVSWGVDEVVDISHSKNVTLQWSLITEGLHDSYHPKGPHSSGLLSYDSSLTLHHNLFAHNNMRNPLVLQQADIVNNVIYNWGSVGTAIGWNGKGDDPHGSTHVNLRNNYYVAGPSTIGIDVPVVAHANSWVWTEGNLLDVDQDADRNPNSMTDLRTSGDVLDQPFAFPPVVVDSAEDAYRRVLDRAGASIVRDSVDLRIVQEVTHTSGLVIDTPELVGGYPSFRSNWSRMDSDGDGMADSWEIARQLHSFDPTDGATSSDGRGMTHLEEYLDDLAQELVPAEYWYNRVDRGFAVTQYVRRRHAQYGDLAIQLSLVRQASALELAESLDLHARPSRILEYRRPTLASHDVQDDS